MQTPHCGVSLRPGWQRHPSKEASGWRLWIWCCRCRLWGRSVRLLQPSRSQSASQAFVMESRSMLQAWQAGGSRQEAQSTHHVAFAAGPSPAWPASDGSSRAQAVHQAALEPGVQALLSTSCCRCREGDARPHCARCTHHCALTCLVRPQLSGRGRTGNAVPMCSEHICRESRPHSHKRTGTALLPSTLCDLVALTGL